MIPGKLNIVTDAMHGSTGKGLITTAIADKHKPEVLSTTNMANAGHTAVDTNGAAFVAKALPSAAALVKWRPGYKPAIFVGASAAFHLEQIVKEMNETESGELVCIHPRAGVITDTHRQRECTNNPDSTKHIASTMQGCGLALADKIMRLSDVKLASDYQELSQYIFKPTWTRMSVIHQDTSISDTFKDKCDYSCESMPEYLDCVLRMNNTILHEGAQGFSLDINHGQSYPYCTSRGTTAITNLADMGLSPRHLGDIYLVLRPFPIRVGNVVEGGIRAGYSGDCYHDQKELSWEEVAFSSGMPEEYAKILTDKERTTVTKRIRRVFSFSFEQLKQAVLVNGATKIALNFANYIDWSCYASSSKDSLTPKIKEFINKIEEKVGIPVALVGTGPQYDHVIDLS